MGTEDIEPTSLTIRFKHGKNTILLACDALTTISVITEDLLIVLRERYPDGLLSASSASIPIPSQVGNVYLAVPIDVYDPSKGWKEIDTRGEGAERESPKSLGLKDGGMLAFAFQDKEQEANEPEFWVEFSNVDELYPEDG